MPMGEVKFNLRVRNKENQDAREASEGERGGTHWIVTGVSSLREIPSDSRVRSMWKHHCNSRQSSALAASKGKSVPDHRDQAS